MLRFAVPPNGDVEDLWNRLPTVKTSGARLLVSAAAVQPITFGLLRPTILIPTSYCRPEFRRQLWFVLQHELVHVERRDALSWMLANVARAVLYHQPVFWWIRRQLRFSQEYVADSCAARAGLSVADYAQVLTDVAAHLNRRRGAIWQGIGIFHSHSELYRRVEMLSRADSVAVKWCGSRINLQTGLCACAAVMLLSLLTLRAGAQPEPSSVAGTQAASSKDETTDASFSRIWYLVRQPNTMGLFHGLPQRMEPFSTAKSRTGEVWEGVADGAKLQLRLDVESENTEDVFVGFFADARWWLAPPVQVRCFAGAGEYTVSGLPPGTYFIGAIMGSFPRPDALGLERAWPEGVAVQSRESAEAHVLISDKFRWHSHMQNPRDFVGDWPKLDPSRLVTVRTIDGNGAPVPYCHVRYSVNIGSDFGTDQKGYTYRDDIVGGFSVSAIRNSFDPVTLAQRYHSMQFAELHDATDRPVIQVVWEPFPSGPGTVAGTVHDQLGHPLTEFHLNIGHERDRPDGSEAFGMRIPIINPDGRFEVHGLIPGGYTITASAFDYPTHVYQWGEERLRFTIGQPPNDTVEVDVELEARQLRYGRAVYEDGAPVRRGSWSGPPGSYSIQPNGRFRVSMSRNELERLASFENGKIEVKAYAPEGARSTEVEVAWDDLSEERTQPLTVVLARPESSSDKQVRGRVPQTVDDPAAILRLKQLGAFVNTRDDGSVQEVSFLESRFRDSDAILLQKLPNIEELSFNRTQIGDATLTHVKELSNLRKLELPNADVTDWGIAQLRDLSNLRSLNLMRTDVTDAGLRAVGSLSGLEDLDLSSTKVTDAGMEHLAQLTNLRTLNLWGTAITDAGLVHIGRLTYLEELVLSGLPITDEGLGRIAGLTALTRLQLNGSKVTDDGLKHLSGMKGLATLDVGRTLVTDEGVDAIAKFSSLERLHLSRTNVTDACLSKLTALKNLRVLYIDPNISDAGLSQITAFPQLEVLGVGGPNITDAGVERIAKLTGLTNLFLDRSNITDASVPHLIQLRKLLLLSVRRTKITPDGMQQFYESFSGPPQVFGP